MAKTHDDFFVGYLRGVPRGSRSLMILVILAFVGAMSGAGYFISATQPDPGPGRFFFEHKTFTGILETAPYPLVRVAPNETYPEGHTLLLAGQGKRGVQATAAALAGKVVDVGGVLLKRGTIDMLQVGRRVPLQASVDRLSDDAREAIDLSVTDLGTWRLTGEICDGKCYVGAMRPGTGIAHKACANLCLNGGVPAVFVSTAPVEGTEFFLLSDQNGNPIDKELQRFVAARVQVDGQIERRGDLMVFKVDLNSVEVL
ncbi:MAG: hypothetical protein P1U69_16665 [Parvibaculaceae bacterium]|nr:hypothetical protein [Parvibaculaceae bacterium]|tara:strand:+ start:5228 stop:5998 length:771 start_codon:yes stop_codon:yes gene_type:complete